MNGSNLCPSGSSTTSAANACKQPFPALPTGATCGSTDPAQLCGLTTSAAVPLPARPAVLLDGSSLGEFLSHLVFQPGHSDQKTLLIDGLLQRFDVRFHLLLHALSEAAQIAASWSEPHETIQWNPGGRQTTAGNWMCGCGKCRQ